MRALYGQLRLRLAAGALTAALAIACGGSAPVSPTPPSPSPAPAPGPSPGSGVSVPILDEDFGGRQILPADNWWNQDISGAPIDPQSSAFIDFIGRTRTGHPDFGPPPYGLPYVGVAATESKAPVAFV